jgi:hypothetical protein
MAQWNVSPMTYQGENVPTLLYPPLIYPNLSNTLRRIFMLRISIVKFSTTRKAVARRIILWFWFNPANLSRIPFTRPLTPSSA